MQVNQWQEARHSRQSKIVDYIRAYNRISSNFSCAFSAFKLSSIYA